MSDVFVVSYLFFFLCRPVAWGGGGLRPGARTGRGSTVHAPRASVASEMTPWFGCEFWDCDIFSNFVPSHAAYETLFYFTAMYICVGNLRDSGAGGGVRGGQV